MTATTVRKPKTPSHRLRYYGPHPGVKGYTVHLSQKTDGRSTRLCLVDNSS